MGNFSANPFDSIQERFDQIEQSLLMMSEMMKSLNLTTPPVSQEDIRFSIDELAVYLRKSKVTIHRYKANGVIPFHQAGRTVYFKKAEVDAALSSIPQPKKRRG